MNRDARQSITEGPVWESAYSQNNYEIEYDYAEGTDSNICAIYFSSSGIYYPNIEEELKKRVIDDDYYEWKKTKIKRARKHIFVRDVAKNFYVIGISKRISSIDALMDFLKEETEGYEIITLGSSGGAYMAVLAGVLLESKCIFCFSCFWSLNCINYDVWHLVGFYQNDPQRNKYYDLVPIIKESNSRIVYIYPANNRDEINNDHVQCELVKNLKQIIQIPVKSKRHGACINRFLLSKLVNLSDYSQITAEYDRPMSEFRIAKKILSHNEILKMYYVIVKDKIMKYIR